MRFTGDRARTSVSEVHFKDTVIRLNEDVLGHHDGVDFFYDYYQKLCTKRNGKPRRKDLNPNDFKKYLPHVVLANIESLDPFALRISLIGTHVSEIYGEATGNLTDELPNQNASTRINAMSIKCIEEEQPVLSITNGIGPNQQHLVAFAYYFPLFDEDGQPVMTLTTVFVEFISVYKKLENENT